MKAKHKRLLAVMAGLASVFIGTFVLLNNFRDNLIYFYPPAEIQTMQKNEPERLKKLSLRQIRVGGMVKQGSYYKADELGHEFVVTDNAADIKVIYSGLLPPMFREGQGVVAQGRLDISSGLIFVASQLITKHDENYMPPEIERSMKKEGSYE